MLAPSKQIFLQFERYNRKNAVSKYKQSAKYIINIEYPFNENKIIGAIDKIEVLRAQKKGIILKNQIIRVS